jgi:hypothetical protein
VVDVGDDRNVADVVAADDFRCSHESMLLGSAAILSSDGGKRQRLNHYGFDCRRLRKGPFQTS